MGAHINSAYQAREQPRRDDFKTPRGTAAEACRSAHSPDASQKENLTKEFFDLTNLAPHDRLPVSIVRFYKLYHGPGILSLDFIYIKETHQAP
jgi:hypothetical protein